MSFEEQERALFDLLFDNGLRARFALEHQAALSAYDLSEMELADFGVIRPDALALDAGMRRNIILGHLCRYFPVSFALVCSLDGGRALLKTLVDARTMRAASPDRAQVFGTRLREALAAFAFDTAAEQPRIMAIVEAELAMAMTAASLRRHLLDGGCAPVENAEIPADWSARPVRLAGHVGAAIIPQPWAELRKAFCPVAPTGLWEHLSGNALGRKQRNAILKREVPRLLVVKAQVSHLSRCDPGVEHRTVELSDGFAPLFQHVDGSLSVDGILAGLKGIGAGAAVLEGVQAGFRQLLENGMMDIGGS